MKLERASKEIVKGYRRTKLLRFLDDFIKTGEDCAKVVYEEGEYARPASCFSALSIAIRRYNYGSIVGVMVRNKTVYLYRKENDDDK